MKTITRRQAIGLLGIAGATSLVRLGDGARAFAQACPVTPEQTEGPYFVDEELERSDIRIDPSDGSVQDGVPLRLQLDVTRVDAARAPAADVQVDVWHANADGLYSDEPSIGTAGTRFLRGYQVTGSDDRVEFVTIYPGWHRGRTTHVHVKVRAFDAGGGTLAEHTSQLYFDDGATAAVTSVAPYASRGTPDTTNASDGIFDEALLMTLVEDGSGGWIGSTTIAVEGFPAATGTDDDDDDEDVDPAACADAAACLALVVDALPDPADGERASRKIARRLARLAA